jgi:hypothetical protein
VPRLKIRSQVGVDDEARTKGILDDCGPSSAACAAAWVLGKEISATEGIAAKAKATGFTEKQGVSDNGSSLSELAKTVKVLGALAKYPKTWEGAIDALRKGHALILNVNNGKPPFFAGVKMSAWHVQHLKRHPGDYYGHMTAAAYDPAIGFQWACPTMSGKGGEEYAVTVTEEQLRAIASSKGDAPEQRTLIVYKEIK